MSEAEGAFLPWSGPWALCPTRPLRFGSPALPGAAAPQQARLPAAFQACVPGPLRLVPPFPGLGAGGTAGVHGAVGRAPPQLVHQAGRGVPLVLAPTGAPFVGISGAAELPFSAVETRAVVSGCLLHSLAPSALDPPP